VASADALVVNCILAANFANEMGGGTFGGRLMRCRLTGNMAGRYGGGEYWSVLHGCSVRGNSAATGGGGYLGSMYNCTVIENSASVSGGGIEAVDPMNSIIYYNSVGGAFDDPLANWHASYQSHCCSTPKGIVGDGNITLPPQLLDEVHLATTSPCRGAGVVGPDSMWNMTAWRPLPADLDGEAWTNPPSIGCDEVWEAAIRGPLSVGLLVGTSTLQANRNGSFTGTVTGRASRVSWDFGDGVAITNESWLSISHPWTNPGVYRVTFTAFNADHPEGVATNVSICVVPLLVPAITLAAGEPSRLALRFEGQAGVSYVLEQATNLVPPAVWQPVSRYIGSGGPLEFVDPSTTNDMRFYRVMILP